MFAVSVIFSEYFNKYILWKLFVFCIWKKITEWKSFAICPTLFLEERNGYILWAGQRDASNLLWGTLPIADQENLWGYNPTTAPRPFLMLNRNAYFLRNSTHLKRNDFLRRNAYFTKVCLFVCLFVCNAYFHQECSLTYEMPIFIRNA